MLRTVLRRLLHLVPVLLLVSVATFLMMDLVEGSPEIAILGADATEEQYAAVRQDLRLDDPLIERFGGWLSDVLKGDLGRSYVPPVQDVSEMIRLRLPVTAQIAVMGMLISLILAVPAALVAGYRATQPVDRVTSSLAFAAISVPSFLAALLLIYVMVFHPEWVRTAAMLGGAALASGLVAGAWRRARAATEGAAEVWRTIGGRLAAAAAVLVVAYWAYRSWPALPRQGYVRWSDPRGGFETLRHAFLPALTLGLIEAGVLMRLLRSDLITTLQEDYILQARAKGMPITRVLIRDALRPSSFSLLTVAGVTLGRLIGGTVVVETIFNVPGMGTMLVKAIGNNDLAVVQGAVLAIAVCYVLINTLVDISYAYLDPRIRRRHA